MIKFKRKHNNHEKILKQSKDEQEIVLKTVNELLEKIERSLKSTEILEEEENFLKSNYKVLQNFKMKYKNNI